MLLSGQKQCLKVVLRSVGVLLYHSEVASLANLFPMIRLKMNLRQHWNHYLPSTMSGFLEGGSSETKLGNQVLLGQSHSSL